MLRLQRRRNEPYDHDYHYDDEIKKSGGSFRSETRTNRRYIVTLFVIRFISVKRLNRIVVLLHLIVLFQFDVAVEVDKSLFLSP